MKFTIEREKWLHGEGTKESKLLREADEKMCCLGFFLKACGATNEDIANIGSPSSCTFKVPTWLLYKEENSEECEELMDANDDEAIKDDAREKRIAEVFSARNIEVDFK